MTFIRIHMRRAFAYLLIFCFPLPFCLCQVNIIGIPHSERAAELTVRDGNGNEIDPRKPFGSATPGGTLVLYCETKHPSISHIAWSRDGVEFFGSVSRFSDGLLQNELKVTLGPAEKNAEFKCRGLNLRYDSIVERVIRVDIGGEKAPESPFTAIISPSNGTYKVNDTVSLKCLVQGARGPAIITWWKGEKLMNGTAVSAAPSITIRNGITSTESSLTFKAALNDSSLPIFCRAISALSQLNDNLTAEDSIKLDILYTPVAHIMKNESISSKENGPINIPCSLRANPPVDRVRWYRNDKLIHEEKFKNDTVTNALNLKPAGKMEQQTNALRILQVSRNDIGYYSCEGHNIVGWGQKSNSVEVKVQYKPGPARTLKQQSSTVIHATEGERLTLTCTVADPGSPPAYTFIWRKDGVFLSKGQTHTINPIQEKHFGSYTCAPFNGAGEGDAAAITLQRKEGAGSISDNTILLIAGVSGVVGGTILFAILVYFLCLRKSCRNGNKHDHLTSKFMSAAYPIHTLPRPQLITNHPASSTLSREHGMPRSSSQKQHSPVSGGGFAFGSSFNNHGSRPNYYPSWYSQKTERSNSYLGRGHY